MSNVVESFESFQHCPQSGLGRFLEAYDPVNDRFVLYDEDWNIVKVTQPGEDLFTLEARQVALPGAFRQID